MLMSGAFVWRDSDLGVGEDLEKDFEVWLIDNLSGLVLSEICDENIVINNELKVNFRYVEVSSAVDDIIERDHSVYEVILNGHIGSSLFLREFEDNYSKTFVSEIHEYLPSHKETVVLYGTSEEWESYWEYLEERVVYKGN